jgi:hypothetical protein
MLHFGNCDVANSAPDIGFGKDTFFFVIGDYRNTNTSNTLTPQLAISYNTPVFPLIINFSGYVTIQYGNGGSSDGRIKQILKLVNMH